ncbi:ankyrin repeat, SAM and basic leucine zipper domain-containing protein 1 isoform X1 [Betta splendens]|uniref:Ankyrin repeat, SAM and basic leucine zipper domain-containing protein 1 isoform X1 n=1 Tax=Betta splendens TaxID=158456 RepID=A0A6P7MSN9_BETSP|nr:ankyrin repeat, SAM and basic leucine zipper domain-containing protein 1 isoform X1 [Betta splendens]
MAGVGFLDYAFAAGDESDASNDDWDIGCSDAKMKVVEAVVPHAGNGESRFKTAIRQGDAGTVEQLLDEGVDVETRLDGDRTPLMCAVDVANCDLAKLLLDRGASANFSKGPIIRQMNVLVVDVMIHVMKAPLTFLSSLLSDCWTVLMASCTASASEDKIARCVELLLSRNADPNMVDRSRMTCLMLAARDGYSKVLNLLVSHGAEINVQDCNGYTALAIAVQYGREEAVLKLLQLGADKTLRTKTGKSPADLAALFKHTQIIRILASSSHISTVTAFASMEDTLSKFLKTNSEPTSSKENSTKLDDLELLLHGLNLGYLTDIMTKNDITWSSLLTMEEADLEKIGIKDPTDQQKVLSAVKLMHLDKVDLDNISHLENATSGSEELYTFLISLRQQCCYLTETIQDVISRFPCQVTQIVFSLDPNKEAQAVCNQLVLQTSDLHKEATCLRNLLCQMHEAGDCRLFPRPGSDRSWSDRRRLKTAALGALGAALVLLLYKAASGKGFLQMYRNVC